MERMKTGDAASISKLITTDVNALIEMLEYIYLDIAVIDFEAGEAIRDAIKHLSRHVTCDRAN